MDEKEIQDALDAVCNVGPYDFDFTQSTSHIQIWHCRACGAEVHLGTTASQPTWAHYKPGQDAKTTITAAYSAPPPLFSLDPNTNAVTPALDEDRVRALITEAIDAAEDRLVDRVFNKLVVRLRTRTLP